jgi:hypothetical protein
MEIEKEGDVLKNIKKMLLCLHIRKKITNFAAILHETNR